MRQALAGVGGVIVAVMLASTVFGQAPEGKPGRTLRLIHREDLPQGFAIHETATNSVTWPAMPCYSLTGLGVDDPDANFYENYACGSSRNYPDYCDEQVTKMIDEQSQELDPKKRMALVAQIQKKLEEDAARPTLGWRVDRFAHQGYVKNLIPQQVVYNCCRLAEVWLDK